MFTIFGQYHRKKSYAYQCVNYTLRRIIAFHYSSFSQSRVYQYSFPHRGQKEIAVWSFRKGPDTEALVMLKSQPDECSIIENWCISMSKVSFLGFSSRSVQNWYLFLILDSSQDYWVIDLYACSIYAQQLMHNDIELVTRIMINWSACHLDFWHELHNHDFSLHRMPQLHSKAYIR